jgi:hypothetical protein
MLKSKAPLWRVRSVLTLLVLSCLLPGLLGAIILLTQQYRQGRQQLEQNTLQTARALAQAVDNHVFRARAIAQVLAASEALTTGDLVKFQRQAQEAVTASGLATKHFFLTKPASSWSTPPRISAAHYRFMQTRSMCGRFSPRGSRY